MEVLEFILILFNRYIFDIIDALGRVLGIAIPIF